MTPIRSAARALLGAIFIGSGLTALRHTKEMATMAGPVTDRLRAFDVNTTPETLVKVNGTAQVVGGLLLASGHLTRPAAAVLAGSLVPTTLAAHPFWAETDPARKAEQRTQFAKNMGLLGGLLLAVVDTGGRPNLRWRATYAAKRAGASAHRAAGAARRAEHSLVRGARTARREARIAVRAASLGRRLPG